MSEEMSLNHQKHGSSASSPAPGDGRSGSEKSAGSDSAGRMYSLKWNNQVLYLQRSLANLWESGIGFDAVLLCQGTSLPAHKIILAAASPYVATVVQAMGQAAQMMMPVIVVDVPAEAGKILLKFVYCGEAIVPAAILPHVISGVKLLRLPELEDPRMVESAIMHESRMTPDKAPPPSPGQEPGVSQSLRSLHSQIPTGSEQFMPSAEQVNLDWPSESSKYCGNNQHQKPAGGNANSVRTSKEARKKASTSSKPKKFKPPAKYTCEGCGKTYCREFYLKAHVQKMHSTNVIKEVFKCRICDYISASREGWRVHYDSCHRDYSIPRVSSNGRMEETEEEQQ